jgi:hypothetical protein
LHSGTPTQSKKTSSEQTGGGHFPPLFISSCHF